MICHRKSPLLLGKGKCVCIGVIVYFWIKRSIVGTLLITALVSAIGLGEGVQGFYFWSVVLDV